MYVKRLTTPDDGKAYQSIELIAFLVDLRCVVVVANNIIRKSAITVVKYCLERMC